MKSEQYWTKRMDDLNEAMLGKGEAYIQTQNAEYEKSMARIRKETESWYARLAKNNNVGMAEARKLLTAGELKEFRWSVDDYIKAGRENAVDQRWMKQLENASARAHITRLEELQTKLRQEVELLAAKRQAGAARTMGDIYKDGYHRGIFEVQRGVGEGVPFARLDGKQIDAVLAKPWAPDGKNFSARIWADRDKLAAELQTVLTQNLIRGEPSEKTIAAFAERMGVSKENARRLILTEAAYFSGQSRLDGYKQTSVDRYKFVATLDARTSDQCRHMDGEVIPVSEAQAGTNYPPLHAHCRSTTIPYFEDEEPGKRAARGDDDMTYEVPGDMTYKDWAAKHAPSDAVKPPDSEPPAPKEPPKVVPVTPPELLAPAKTVKEAEDVARTYGFDDVDYSLLHLDSANAINGAIDRALREFPGLKGFARKISAVKDDSFIAQARAQFNRGSIDSELKVSSIHFNGSEIDDIIKEAITVKYWPAGSNTQSLIVHEFGHLAEYAHGMKLMGAWSGAAISHEDAQIVFARINRGVLSRDIIAEALTILGIENRPENIMQELSEYAITHSKEALAEAVAEAVGTDNPRRLASQILRILKRKLSEVGL